MDTSVKETWHAVGFTEQEPYDMSYSDFIVSMYNRNYSGARDLYKYDAGNNYPCWDALTQCSADGASAGTMDLENGFNAPQNGISVSTWHRELVTGDFKDSEFTAEDD